MPEVMTLPEGADVMCAFCVHKATHFYIVSYSHGSLMPACPSHAENRMYG